MTRADKLLATAVLVAAIAGIAFPWVRSALLPGMGNGSSLAVVKVRGEIVRKVALSEGGGNSTFTVNGRLGPCTVEIDGKRIRMREAPCPDRICVRQGWIEKGGESVVCVPGEVMIGIEGRAPVDAVTR
jgi:hypothetical protein